MTDLFLDTFTGPARQILARKGWDVKHMHGQHAADWDGWNPISLDGLGHLKITAKYDPATNRWKSGWPSGTVPLTGPRRIECQMRCPIHALGFWPAFWEWPYPYGTAHDSNGIVIPGLEVDTVEILTRELSEAYNYHHATVHLWQSGYTEAPGSPKGKMVQDKMDLHRFQTYASDILPDRIIFYFNGEVVYTVMNTDLGVKDFTKFTNVLNLTLDVGRKDDWPGPPNTTDDQHMLVNYVHVTRI